LLAHLLAGRCSAKNDAISGSRVYHGDPHERFEGIWAWRVANKSMAPSSKPPHFSVVGQRRPEVGFSVDLEFMRGKGGVRQRGCCVNIDDLEGDHPWWSCERFYN